MTDAELTTLAAAIRASTDSTVIAALADNNGVVIANWLNTPSTVLAWREEVPKQDLFEAMNITTFDSLSAGKRDAWGIVLDSAPIDATRAALRKGILDIFSATDAGNILTACTEYAKRLELIFFYESKTSGTVTAIKRNFVGSVSPNEVSIALNEH